MDERHQGRGDAVGAVLLKIALFPLFTGARFYYWLADTIAAARSELKPSLPADPVSSRRFDSDEAAAQALVAGLLEVVPDVSEVAPLSEWARAADLRVIALSSPRLDTEQVLVSWDAESLARTFVWVEFEGLAGGDPIEWTDGEDLREVFWTAAGMLREGIRYQPDRRGRTNAWIFVAETDGWARWGVDHTLGEFEPRWFTKPPDQA